MSLHIKLYFAKWGGVLIFKDIEFYLKVKSKENKIYFWQQQQVGNI